MTNAQEAISKSCGIIIFVVSLTIMSGWLFQIPTLIFVNKFSPTPTYFATALCLFLTSIAVIFGRWHKKLFPVMGIAVSVIASFYLLLYFFKFEFQLDQFILKTSALHDGLQQGRPAFNTLISLLLVGF